MAVGRRAPACGCRRTARGASAPSGSVAVSGSGSSGGSGNAKPVEILVNTREHEVNDQALAALAAREPNLFERAGVLVQVIRPAS